MLGSKMGRGDGVGFCAQNKDIGRPCEIFCKVFAKTEKITRFDEAIRSIG